MDRAGSVGVGMRLLTYAFIALVVPLAAVTRGSPVRGRALWAAALAVFAVSALHLSQLHNGERPGRSSCSAIMPRCRWRSRSSTRTTRFALADLFLKRALALLGIVALAFVAIATFGDALGRRSPTSCGATPGRSACW